MPIGTVKFFNADKGYGFIQPEDGGADSFVHISAVERAGMVTLNKDQRVSYEVEMGKNGKASAVNLSAAFRLIRGSLRGMMKKRWGRIIAVTSVVRVKLAFVPTMTATASAMSP